MLPEAFQRCWAGMNRASPHSPALELKRSCHPLLGKPSKKSNQSPLLPLISIRTLLSPCRCPGFSVSGRTEFQNPKFWGLPQHTGTVPLGDGLTALLSACRRKAESGAAVQNFWQKGAESWNPCLLPSAGVPALTPGSSAALGHPGLSCYQEILIPRCHSWDSSQFPPDHL